MTDFDSLAEDGANLAAIEAARAVVDARGRAFAPLVIVGPRGSGKTELLRTMAGAIRAKRPSERVEVLDPGSLTTRYREALVAGKTEDYRARLAEAEVLLLDDLDSLPRHRECQELLTELLDVRRTAGRETVVVSSESPAVMDGLDPRVSRRLQLGTQVRLSLPGAAARLGLLRARASGRPNPVSPDVLQALADAELPSLRDYFGALSRLLAFQEASAAPLGAEDAMILVGVSHTGMATAAPVAAGSPPENEFDAFLSDVADEVAGQLDRWRQRVEAAIERWGSEGLRTRRLEVLLEAELVTDPDPALREFEAAAAELVALASEAATISPDLAGAEAFRDPDQVAAARLLVDAARSRTPVSTPLPQYRWEEFIEGPTSHLAVRAGREVLKAPGERYSPLLVVAAPGSGKSHYLHGLGNALIARGIAPVACLAGPAFAAEVRALADAPAAAEWRRRYQWAGAFLLDDLHLLTGDSRAQHELAALVGELLEGRRQVVCASQRSLEHLPGLDPRLAGLLQTGLTVDLPPPDREVRIAIIRRQLADRGAAEDAALLDYLAGRPVESVRALQGLVQRVLGAAAAQQVAPSPQLAREVLEHGPGLRRSRPGPGGAGRGGRASGIPAPGAGLVRSREKMIKQWPRITDRLIAELR